MKHLKDFKTFEGVNNQNDYKEGDVVLIRYQIAGADAIITPVKIIKCHTKNKFTISHKTDDSFLKNFPNITISAKDIISYYKAIDEPVNTIYSTQNPRINPKISGMIPGGSAGHPTNDIAI